MDYTCEAMRRMEQNQSSDTFHYHPYRQRKNSSTSTYSDCSSLSASPSSSTMTSTPPPQNCSANIYDRLKDYISEVPKDPIVCQILLNSLAHIIELERQLADLEQKTENLKMHQCPPPPYYASTKLHHEKVPEDLVTVDVSEFKHLVYSAPLVYDTISY
ncbi:hypothetical protein L3Y34_001466 [Caenorhabditis briggsae]|uniref:Uncharacterized protein n=1 Tax=Caenorhabditis briggsae TaxID=6238 RepID=A0AAE9DCS3_CAEBR|nr:hypothetical protein L3Y34_001466 [Caenorhabditis briggsae]